MESLTLLASFIHSADAGSFSDAARKLGLTPAAVSKNVSRLEAQLGIRLFQRSTRVIALTAGGETFYREVFQPYTLLRDAFANAAQVDGQPAGVLKVGMAVSFGTTYLVPLLQEFLAQYPAIIPDWHFGNIPVDMIGGGFDAAIGGGMQVTAGVVAREMFRTYVVATASPAYMRRHRTPSHPDDLACLDGIARRSSSTGRLKVWCLQNGNGERALAEPKTRMMFDDPDAMAKAAVQGMGVAMLPMAHALPYLESGSLVRLLPGWYADNGPQLLYYPNRRLLPSKTRVFIDFIVDAFQRGDVAHRFDAR